MDGGLWVSPQGKAYAVEDYHVDFVEKYPYLFGLTEAVLVSFKQLRSSMDDCIISYVLKKGWARVRFCESRIFITALRSPHVDRLLSKVGEAILECGYPLTSIAKVELLEADGDSLSVPHSYYSASEETLSSLIAASYTPLYSGSKNAIFSMAGDGFKNKQEIYNWMSNILFEFRKERPADWTFSSEDLIQGNSHFLKGLFTSGAVSRSVVFKEEIKNEKLWLSVTVDSNEVFSMEDGCSFNAVRSYKMLSALMGRPYAK